MTNEMMKAIESLKRQAAEQATLIAKLTGEIKNDVDSPRASLFQIGTQAHFLSIDELETLGEMIARETKAINEKIAQIKHASRHQEMLEMTIAQFEASK